MENRLTDIELLVTKLSLEQQQLELLERKRVVQRHCAGIELQAVELLIEKLRLEKLRDTLHARDRLEHSRRLRKTGLIRAL